jgi:hypothetical protein
VVMVLCVISRLGLWLSYPIKQERDTSIAGDFMTIGSKSFHDRPHLNNEKFLKVTCYCIIHTTL